MQRKNPGYYKPAGYFKLVHFKPRFFFLQSITFTLSFCAVNSSLVFFLNKRNKWCTYIFQDISALTYRTLSQLYLSPLACLVSCTLISKPALLQTKQRAQKRLSHYMQHKSFVIINLAIKIEVLS